MTPEKRAYQYAIASRGTYPSLKQTVDALAEVIRTAENEALERANRWEPIETAPKDGREILAYGTREMFVVWWQSGSWCFVDTPQGGKGFAEGLTHWQPLPTPPHPHPTGEEG